MRIAVLVLTLPALASCVATSPPSEVAYSLASAYTDAPVITPAPADALVPEYAPAPQAPFTPPPPRPSGMFVQGLIGASSFNAVNVDLDSSYGNVVDEGDETFPLLGGVFQRALQGSDKTHFGFESGFTLGWQGNVSAVAVGGGGLVVAADNDVFLFDWFGGPFFDVLLGQRTRVYVGGGPLLQWASVELDWDQPGGHVHTHESGFGFGWYVRTGIEFALRPGLQLGFGVRWVDAYADFSGAIDEIDFEGEQYYLTVTESL
jgi:hypothetical protein